LTMAVVIFFGLKFFNTNVIKFKIKKSFILVIVFVIWASIKTVIDSMNIEEVKSITTGSEAGILYYMMIGIMTSKSVMELNDYIDKKNINYKKLILMLIILWGVFYFNYKNFIVLLGDVRPDIFLLEDQHGYYQRFANYVIIQTIICGYLIALHTNINKGLGPLLFFFGIISFILSSFVLVVTSQLVGSNAAFGFIVGYLFILLFFVYFNKLKLLKYGVCAHEFKSNEFNIVVVKHAILFIFFITTLIAFAINYLVDAGSLNLDLFRVTGFGKSEVSSINSRLNIISENFITHLMYSPFFGNTQVDELTTGKGTYIHSTLSIITHLGLFGFILFISSVLKVYGNIGSFKLKVKKLSFTNKAKILFNKVIFFYVLIFGFMIAFYTWAPLWFIIGFYSVWKFSKEYK
jgi:hypothetical protein